MSQFETLSFPDCWRPPPSHPNWSVLVKNCNESVTDEDFDLASTWFNDTSVPSQYSVSNEEGLDASESASVVSYSVIFTDYLVKDVSDNTSSRISEEAITSVSKEDCSSASKEGGPSVSEEGSSSVSEEAAPNCPEE